MYGSGKQTRSFQYVSDLVDGMVALMTSNYTQPVNLGNPVERTIQEFAEIIRDQVGGRSKIIELPAVEDDPQRRKPDISRAKKYLNWEPRVSVFVLVRLRKTFFSNMIFSAEGPPEGGPHQNSRILSEGAGALQSLPAEYLRAGND